MGGLQAVAARAKPRSDAIAEVARQALERMDEALVPRLPARVFDPISGIVGTRLCRHGGILARRRPDRKEG